MPYSASTDAYAIACAATRNARKVLIAAQERLKELVFLINSTLAIGGAPAQALIDERTFLESALGIPLLQTDLTDCIADEITKHEAVHAYYGDVKTVLTELPQTLPVLLFPVRIETALDADARRLYVRVYPDDIAVETHEPALTASEISTGKDYWRNAIDSTKKAAAWDVLSKNFGAPRAAWIMKALTPTNIGSNPTDPETLIFPATETKFESWTQQPHTRILPDAFVVTAYHYNSSTTIEAIGSRIDYSVKLGIDPENDASMERTGNLIDKEPALNWMYDFAAAEAAGLGISIELTQPQVANGFDRLVVLGVKFSLSAEDSQELVEELFDNHHYTAGLSVLKQGTPTSNTPTIKTDYQKREAGNAKTFEAETGGLLFTPTADTMLKSDGQILADMLGISYETLQHTANSGNFDIRNAIALNNVLWEATGGYYMRDMLYPLCDATTIQQTRTFFTNHVLGGGTIPGIRIGKHPYGIIANSIISSITWPENVGSRLTYQLIQETTETFATTWNTLAQNTNYASRSSVDPQQVIIDLAARHGVSVDYYQRTGVGASYIWNNLIFSGRAADASQWRLDQQAAAQIIATDTTLAASPTSRILQTNFLEQHTQVTTPLISSSPSSDTLPTFPLEQGNDATPMNFLEWLRTATCDQIQTHNFGPLTQTTQTDPPESFLYRMTRQAVLLEYFHASGTLRNMTPAQLRESELINVAPQGTSIPAGENVGGSTISFSTYAGQSRWKVLNNAHPGSSLSSSQFIDGGFANGNPALTSLLSVRNDIQHLEQLPVADLNLLTSAHLDTLSFRLDAWRLGLVSERLAASRNVVEVGETISRTMGLFVGAYGWVESVRLRNETTLVAAPTEAFSGDIEGNNSNQGFIHAPSINHATTAAVLRSGYLSRAEETRPETLAVNLSSERVRVAMDYIDAVRNGSDLPTLLGYQFERGLHERYPTLGLDTYITALRNKYPLHRFIQSKTVGAEQDSVASRAVLNGLKIVQDYRAFLIANPTAPERNFFLQIPGLEELSDDPIINPSIVPSTNAFLSELKRLDNIIDAIGDLSVAEGLFQTIQGNTVKANAMATAVANGKNIPVPDVVKTPRTGVHLDNRITLNFVPVIASTVLPATPWDGITASVRSTAEPTLNYWLNTLMGDPALIKCKTTFVDSPFDLVVTLADLDIQPIDYLIILPESLANDASELAQHIRRYVRQATAITDDVVIAIDYTETDGGTGVRSFYELHSLMLQVKKVLGNSRNLKTEDFLASALGELVPNRYNAGDLYARYVAALSQLDDEQGDLADALADFSTYAAATALQPASFTAMRAALYACSFYGIDGIVFESNTDVSEAAFNALSTAGIRVNDELIARSAAVLALGISSPNLSSETDEAYVENIQKAIALIFGNAFRFLPHYKYRTEEAAVLTDLYNSNGGTLLNDHLSNAFITEEWLQGVARVRKKAGDFEMLSLLASAWDSSHLDLFALKPAQFPYAIDGTERWMAVKITQPAPPLPHVPLKENRLALGMCLPTGFVASSTSNQSGLMIDEWVEVIPNQTETTGVAFHYEQPGSKPPQCLILATSPTHTSEGGWDWENLLAIVNNTLDEAKRRAVDYEDISATSLGHILPAVVLPVTVTNTTIGFTTNQVH
ncbi:MAG: hypothetical protein ABIQ40_02035 [Bacteroidia bacterium]